MSEADYYPAGAYNDPNAPWNEVEVPDMEFDVTISMSLSKTVKCSTNKYNPVVIDEPHNRLHEEYPDTSDTPWSEVYGDNHKTIPELLSELKKYIQKDLDNLIFVMIFFTGAAISSAVSTRRIIM